MTLYLLLIKMISVVIILLGLTTLAQRVDTKLSGIVSGLPIGSSITLIFFAIEYGTDYIQQSALYNIHGLFAALAFSVGYYISTFYKGRWSIIVTIIGSFSIYFMVSYSISFFKAHIIWTPLAVYGILIVCATFFSKKENHKILMAQTPSKIELTVRIVLTIALFLIVSSLPAYVSPNLAGIFSSFPTILLPFLVIIHISYGHLQARTIAKNTPFGLTSVVLYSYLVYITYPLYGIFLGTLMSWLGAMALIIIQIKLFRYFNIIL